MHTCCKKTVVGGYRHLKSRQGIVAANWVWDPFLRSDRPTVTAVCFAFCSGQIDVLHQEKVIREGFEELVQNNDFVVVEGTGHTGESRVSEYCHDRILPPATVVVHPDLHHLYFAVLCQASGVSSE